MTARFKKGETAPALFRVIPPEERVHRVVSFGPVLTSKPACADCGSTTRELLDSDACKEKYGFRVKLVGVRDIACWRVRRKDRREKARNSWQVRSFGITVEEGDTITALQGGGCICAPWTGYNGNSRSLSTDHDHETGMIRGKLCKHCNDLLGRVKDDPRYFEAMIAYLTDPPAKRALGERYVPEG